MLEEKKCTRPVEPESPESEEEVPFDRSSPTVPNVAGRTKEISEKDNRAYWLTIFCLLALFLLSCADACCERDIVADSQMLESFVETVKYVITTSLGFFFATTVAKKE